MKEVERTSECCQAKKEGMVKNISSMNLKYNFLKLLRKAAVLSFHPEVGRSLLPGAFTP